MCTYSKINKPVSKDLKKISNTLEVIEHLKDFMKKYDMEKEHIVLIGLDSRYNVIYCNVENIGGIDGVTIEACSLFKKVIIKNCKRFVLAHNHPTNDTKPSEEDIAITKRIIQGAKLLDLVFLEHIIFASDFSGYQSVEL